jgi:5-methylcytosine-specific restriction endonuclease McrA
MSVFVLDKRKRPLMPCSEKRARLLLERGRAVVHRRYPFTIRLKDRTSGEVQPVRVKLDPGSKTTGVAVVREDEDEQHVLHLAEIIHRGAAVREKMGRRAAFRRHRRGKNLRYRAPRFDNRTRPDGWLPPSLLSRLDNALGWVERYRRLAPVTALSVERVRFDLHLMQRPGISGIEYQQGTLAGYETREFLLEKWGRKCCYCGAEGVPLQIEHIDCKARGGSDRISNLCLACEPCNQRKGALPVEQFLARDLKRLAAIRAQAKAPLKDAAAVNATRNAIWFGLRAAGLPVEAGSGGRTKWNRSRLGIPKAHALDAACVGTVEAVHGWAVPVLAIKATGRGSYQRTRLTAHGFPRGYLMRAKQVRGFQTGDMVRAVVPSGKKAGTHVGRVAVRATGSFNIQTPTSVVQGVHARHCRLIHRADGHAYHTSEGARLLPAAEAGGIRREKVR